MCIKHSVGLVWQQLLNDTITEYKFDLHNVYTKKKLSYSEKSIFDDKNILMKIHLVLLCVMLVSCNKEEPTLVLPNEETILTEVSYGIHERQKMDVYLPKNRSKATKTIIYLHGGGWYMGDKADIKEGAIYFQQQGFAFISINYRLTRTPENNIHPAQMQDIDKVIAFISQKLRQDRGHDGPAAGGQAARQAACAVR